MNLLSSIAKRIVYAVLLLFAVVVLNFVLIHLAPGDIADTIAGEMGGANEEVMQRIRADYGLDLPMWQQLLTYLTGVARFDFGYSFFFNVPVAELILERLPATLLLVITAQILALVVGTFLGIVSARKPNGIVSHVVSLFALFGYAAPVFWTGIILLITFSLLIPLFPIAGMMDVTVSGGMWAKALDVAHHMVLPVFSLSTIFLALYSRLCRASMMEVLGADYIRTARAKGLSESDVLMKHALKNSLSPVVTLAGLQFSAVVSGAVLVEVVFNWPGLGTLALQSILARDTPTILGVLFFSALVVVVGNLLTDLVLRMIDPRIRDGKA